MIYQGLYTNIVNRSRYFQYSVNFNEKLTTLLTFRQFKIR
ncbi:hypothetical protein IM043_gp067 [Bacillus phage SPG24]|nr:hypothetical protein IM043_gp067 [Bacillus phage SPG24]